MIRFPSKKLYLLVSAVLLFSTIGGVLWVFLKIPSQQEKESTRFSYVLKGEFFPQAYGNNSLEKPQPNPIYFTRAIDSIEVSYSYRFLTDKHLSGVTEEVEIRAAVSSPGLWEKEVVLVPPTQKEGDFSISFPLDTNNLLQLAKDISNELEAGAPAPEVVLRAIVHTVAQADKWQVQEEFVHNTRVKVGAATLELVRPLYQSDRGYYKGVSYEQEGSFNYTIHAKPSILYSNLSLEDIKQHSYLPPPPSTAKPLPNPIFFSDAVDSIEASYSYNFLAEKPVTKIAEQVEIRAVVGSPGLWEKEVVLIPPIQKEGSFTISFPLDTNSLLQLAKDIAAEVGVGDPAPEVSLKAIVHTTAEAEKGQVREEFIQSTKVKFGAKTLELVRPFGQRGRGESQGFKYEQRGSFSYTIRTKPSILYSNLSLEDINQHSYHPLPSPSPPKPLSNPHYFTKTIDSIETYYSYSFLTEKPISRAAVEEVEVRAVVGSPGLWEKEVVLVPPTRKEGDFTISFPLDTNSLLQLAKDIAAELGVGDPALEVNLKAIVHTTAVTEKGQVREEFTQSSRVKSGAQIVELVRPLSQQQKGEFQGFRYEHQGKFNYAISLKENKLFGKTILWPESETKKQPWWESALSPSKSLLPRVLHTEVEAITSPWWDVPSLPTRILTLEPDSKPAPVVLKTATSYPADTLQRIDLTYTYEFVSDKTLASETHEVGVTATLSAPGWPGQSFVLVPKSLKREKFTITAPLDFGLFYTVIEAFEKENSSSRPPSFYNLLIRAEVNSIVQSPYGAIKENLQQDIKLSLDKKSVQLPDIRPATKPGTIKEKVLVPSRRGKLARIGSLGALVLVVIVLLYGSWSYRRIGVRRISKIEAEARRAQKKHRDIMVDVESLPSIGGEEKIVRLNSLEELVKTADALMKPVLHETKPEKHTYCVTDGNTLYLYMSEEETPEL